LDIGYALSKFWLDLGTSLSIFFGCYRPGYRERHSLIEAALASSADALGADVARTLVKRLADAMSVKFGWMSPNEMVWEGAFSEAAEAGAHVWYWETGKMLGITRDHRDWRSIPDRLRRLESGPQRARDWARLLLRTGLAQNVRLRSAGTLLRAGSFGNAIYAAGCLLEFCWDEIGSGTSAGTEIADFLARLYGLRESEARDRRWFAGQTLRAWELHLHDAAL
jgi:hypothetical protein